MDKADLEIFDKVKSILMTFKDEVVKKQSFYGSNGRFCVSKENDFNILSVNLAYTNSNSNYISDYQCFDLLKEYIFEDQNGKTPLRIFMTGQSKFNSVITILLKKSPNEQISKNLINLFFTSKDESIYENFLNKAYKAIQHKQITPEFGKAISFQVLSQIGKAGKLPGFDMSHYTNRFPQIMRGISKFKIEQEDYPILHNMFSYYERAIKNSPSVSGPFFTFLKEKINIKDWDEFKKYANEEKNINPGYQMSGMFEEKINPKLHLNINDRMIRNQYPVISLSPNDYSSMMSMIIRCLNRAKSDLNIDFCQSIPNIPNVTTIYFLSKDEKPVEADKMQSVISSTIELYVEIKNKKQEVNENTLITAIQASSLSFELEKNKPETVDKKVFKPSKI